MKHSKKLQACVGIVIWMIVACLVTPLNTMISEKSTSKRIRVPQVKSERYKSDIVWVKTSDGMLLEVPHWQIDQAKVLQVMFVHQKGTNSKQNPVNASMITSKQLTSLQEALRTASNVEYFRQFYSALSKDKQQFLQSLLADAFTLEMQGLASLIITYMFPLEVQQQMGAAALQPAGIIAPVFAYLQKPEKIPLNHKGTITGVAFSPDGNRIISAAAGIDHNVILYDLKNGKEIKNLVEENFPQACIAYSPDGKYIAAGSIREFDSLILWDGVTGEKIKVLGEGKPVNCMAFSADGNYILVGSKFGYRETMDTLYTYKPILYDVKTGKVVSRHQQNVFRDVNNSSFESYRTWMSMECVAYRPNSNDMIVGGEEQGKVYLYRYDCKTFKRIQSFNILLNGNNPSIAVSADGKYLAGGVLELILWDAETGDKIHNFNSFHNGRIEGVTFHPSGGYIVVCYSGFHSNVILFDCRTGNLIRYFDGMSLPRCVAFSPDGYSLLCGGSQGLMLFKLISTKVLDYISTQLNLAQARLLYRLYLAKINHTPVILDAKDLDYQIYLTLPADVQKMVKAFLPFELASDITENAVQEKMKELRSSLFYHISRIWGTYEKKHDEKIKAVKDAMQKFDKNSVAYKACERLLIELELEEAFK